MVNGREQRRRTVRGCLNLTNGTAMAADFYERRLLVRYIQGELDIDQVCALLDMRTAFAIVAAVPHYQHF